MGEGEGGRESETARGTEARDNKSKCARERERAFDPMIEMLPVSVPLLFVFSRLKLRHSGKIMNVRSALQNLQSCSCQLLLWLFRDVATASGC